MDEGVVPYVYHQDWRKRMHQEGEDIYPLEEVLRKVNEIIDTVNILEDRFFTILLDLQETKTKIKKGEL